MDGEQLDLIVLFDFFNFTKEIEMNMGRKFKSKQNQERIIDIDLLTFNEINHKDLKLTLPHPKINERKFVLVPWCEISPDYFLSKYKKNVKNLLNCTKDDSKIIKLNS